PNSILTASYSFALARPEGWRKWLYESVEILVVAAIISVIPVFQFRIVWTVLVVISRVQVHFGRWAPVVRPSLVRGSNRSKHFRDKASVASWAWAFLDLMAALISIGLVLSLSLLVLGLKPAS